MIRRQRMFNSCYGEQNQQKNEGFVKIDSNLALEQLDVLVEECYKFDDIIAGCGDRDLLDSVIGILNAINNAKENLKRYNSWNKHRVGV